MNEFYTKRRPIIPPRTLRTRTTLALVISVFLHGFAFMAASYNLPIYFQSRGASALGSGILLIPYSLMGSLFAIVSGQVIARTGTWRPTLWFGWVSSLFLCHPTRAMPVSSLLHPWLIPIYLIFQAVMVLGYGLMIMLNGTSSR